MVQDGTRVSGVGASVELGRAVVPGMFPEEAPVTQTWRCQHCRQVIEGTRASYNGAPLCHGSQEEPRCYQLVSMYHHEMPCAADPCPGPVHLEHDHG